MGKSERKKELLAAYRQRAVMGGVCLVTCAPTGRVWLFGARDIRAQENRFAFSAATGTPLHPAMGADLLSHGPECFTFQVPEALEKRPEQTDREFLAELAALEDLWRERLTAQGAEFYVT